MIFLKSQGAGRSGKVVKWSGMGLDVTVELTEAELEGVVGGGETEGASERGKDKEAAKHRLKIKEGLKMWKKHGDKIKKGAGLVMKRQKILNSNASKMLALH